MFEKTIDLDFRLPSKESEDCYFLYSPTYFHIKQTQGLIFSFGLKTPKNCLIVLLEKYQLLGIHGQNLCFAGENLTLPLFFSLDRLQNQPRDAVFYSGGFRGISIKPNEPVAKLIAC